MKPKSAAYTAVSSLLLLFCFVWAISSGSVPVSISDITGFLFGKTGGSNYDIVMKIRLPRIIFAMLVGGMLAASGAMLQALLRNPLVDPFITGISSGAAFGAACAIIAGVSGLIMPSIAGALVTMYVVYRLSVAYGSLSVSRLLLIGVMIGSFFSSLIMMLNAIFSKDLVKVVFWLMGDLSNINPGLAMYGIILTVIILSAAIYFANDLNIMATGDDEARSLGVRVELIKVMYFIFAGVLTAVSVALSGVIGFVGLIIPHITRFFIGPDMRSMIPASFISGAAFLLCADTIARTVFLPSEIPVGVITGLIGVPVFIFLMNTRKDA
jgi:iron complex transport system permease protein